MHAALKWLRETNRVELLRISMKITSRILDGTADLFSFHSTPTTMELEESNESN